MELLGTVRRRYAAHAYGGRGFSLIHRTRLKPEPEKKVRGGILDFFKPNLPAINKRIKDEVSSVFTRYAATRDKNLYTALRKEMLKHTESLKEHSLRSDKARREHVRASDRRIDLAFANTASQIKAVKRETESMARRESARIREEARRPPEELPVSRKSAERMMEGRIENAREEARAEIRDSARKSIGEALRRMRDNAEYERMRRGGGRL